MFDLRYPLEPERAVIRFCPNAPIMIHFGWYFTYEE